jgi:hypothetical protein
MNLPTEQRAMQAIALLPSLASLTSVLIQQA